MPDPLQRERDNANGRVKLPKLGWLRLRLSQQVEGAVRKVSLAREGSARHERWFASIQVERSQTVQALDVAPTLGIDLGLAAFAATSEGALVAPLAAQHERLRRHQRSVSRKKKGSSRRKKAVSRLRTLHRKIAHRRSDWLHELTTDLADRHAVVALEDLRIKNMSASARGTAAQPGKNVRQKSGLKRGITDAAWGEFARQLTYKVQWRGGRVILVDAAYTSRTCRVCAHERADNRKSQALFACVACGHTENADVHAARNILARGIAIFEAERQHALSADAAASKDASNTTLAAGHAASACGGAVRRPRGEKPRRLSPGEAGTHRIKGIGVSVLQETSGHACAAGFPGLPAREEVNLRSGL